MIDWTSIGQEAAQLLSGYLQIKSVNPPGDERETAGYLEKILQQRGLNSKQYSSGPGRVNLLAKLSGDGSRKPILLLNHMDVVEADPRCWSSDPFSGEIREGYVWGRGAIDMKGMGIMELLALDLLRRHHPDRTRDVNLLCVADEEEGGIFGTQWMIEHHWPEIEAEYIWDEGGFGLRDMFGPRPVFTVAVAEKKALWIKLIAHGKPGHGGMPHEENAASILMRALQRVQKLNAKYELHPVVGMMFQKIAENFSFPKSMLLKNLSLAPLFKAAQPALTANATTSAMLKDTLSITVLKAGGKENVIPDIAEAILDIRLLPNHEPEQFLDRLQQLIADPRVEIEVLHAPQKARVSDTGSDFFKVMTRVLGELVPGSITAPMLTPGGTDSCYFRGKGVNCYGLFPALIDGDELKRFHGINERISIENLALGTRIIYEVLSQMTA